MYILYEHEVGCAGLRRAVCSLSECGALASSLASSSYSVMGRCSVSIFFTSESVEPKLSDSVTRSRTHFTTLRANCINKASANCDSRTGVWIMQTRHVGWLGSKRSDRDLKWGYYEVVTMDSKFQYGFKMDYVYIWFVLIKLKKYYC